MLELLRLGRLAVVPGIMALWRGDGRGPTVSILHPGCMIPLLAIKFSASGALCSDFLVSSHPFNWIKWAHRDVDAGQSILGVVVVIVMVSV